MADVCSGCGLEEEQDEPECSWTVCECCDQWYHWWCTPVAEWRAIVVCEQCVWLKQRIKEREESIKWFKDMEAFVKRPFSDHLRIQAAQTQGRLFCTPSSANESSPLVLCGASVQGAFDDAASSARTQCQQQQQSPDPGLNLPFPASRFSPARLRWVSRLPRAVQQRVAVPEPIMEVQPTDERGLTEDADESLSLAKTDEEQQLPAPTTKVMPLRLVEPNIDEWLDVGTCTDRSLSWTSDRDGRPMLVDEDLPFSPMVHQDKEELLLLLDRDEEASTTRTVASTGCCLSGDTNSSLPEIAVGDERVPGADCLVTTTSSRCDDGEQEGVPEDIGECSLSGGRSTVPATTTVAKDTDKVQRGVQHERGTEVSHSCSDILDVMWNTADSLSFSFRVYTNRTELLTRTQGPDDDWNTRTSLQTEWHNTIGGGIRIGRTDRRVDGHEDAVESTSVHSFYVGHGSDGARKRSTWQCGRNAAELGVNVSKSYEDVRRLTDGCGARCSDCVAVLWSIESQQLSSPSTGDVFDAGGLAQSGLKLASYRVPKLAGECHDQVPISSHEEEKPLLLLLLNKDMRPPCDVNWLGVLCMPVLRPVIEGEAHVMLRTKLVPPQSTKPTCEEIHVGTRSQSSSNWSSIRYARELLDVELIRLSTARHEEEELLLYLGKDNAMIMTTNIARTICPFVERTTTPNQPELAVESVYIPNADSLAIRVERCRYKPGLLWQCKDRLGSCLQEAYPIGAEVGQ